MASQVESLPSDSSSDTSSLRLLKLSRTISLTRTTTTPARTSESQEGGDEVLLDRTNTCVSTSSNDSRTSMTSTGSVLGFQKRKWKSPSSTRDVASSSSSSHARWNMMGADLEKPLRARIPASVMPSTTTQSEMNRLTVVQGQTAISADSAPSSAETQSTAEGLSTTSPKPKVNVISAAAVTIENPSSTATAVTIENPSSTASTMELIAPSDTTKNATTPMLVATSVETEQRVVQPTTNDTQGNATRKVESPNPVPYTTPRTMVSQLLEREAFRPRATSLCSTSTWSSAGLASASPALSCCSVEDTSPQNDGTKRVRKVKSKGYDLEAVRAALNNLHLEMIKSGRCNVRSAAREFRIPPETLRRFWNDIKDKSANERSKCIPNTQLPLTGNQKKRYFSVKQEKEMANVIRARDRQGKLITCDEISAIASEKARKIGHIDAKCGRRWVDGFLRRNKDLVQLVVVPSSPEPGNNSNDPELETTTNAKRRRLSVTSDSTASVGTFQGRLRPRRTTTKQSASPDVPIVRRKSSRRRSGSFRKVITSSPTHTPEASGSPAPTLSLQDSDSVTPTKVDSFQSMFHPHTPPTFPQFNNNCSNCSPSTIGQTPSPVAKGPRPIQSWSGQSMYLSNVQNWNSHGVFQGQQQQQNAGSPRGGNGSSTNFGSPFQYTTQPPPHHQRTTMSMMTRQGWMNPFSSSEQSSHGMGQLSPLATMAGVASEAKPEPTTNVASNTNVGQTPNNDNGPRLGVGDGGQNPIAQPPAPPPQAHPQPPAPPPTRNQNLPMNAFLGHQASHANICLNTGGQMYHAFPNNNYGYCPTGMQHMSVQFSAPSPITLSMILPQNFAPHQPPNSQSSQVAEEKDVTKIDEERV